MDDIKFLSEDELKDASFFELALYLQYLNSFEKVYSELNNYIKNDEQVGEVNE